MPGVQACAVGRQQPGTASPTPAQASARRASVISGSAPASAGPGRACRCPAAPSGARPRRPARRPRPRRGPRRTASPDPPACSSIRSTARTSFAADAARLVWAKAPASCRTSTIRSWPCSVRRRSDFRVPGDVVLQAHRPACSTLRTCPATSKRGARPRPPPGPRNESAMNGQRDRHGRPDPAGVAPTCSSASVIIRVYLRGRLDGLPDATCGDHAHPLIQRRLRHHRNPLASA